MKIVSLDIETTGLDPETDQILQIGALVFNLDDETEPNVAQCPVFNAYIKHKRVCGDLYALHMNGHILKILAETKTPIGNASDVANELTEWIGTDRFVFAGKNFTGFDLRFLRRLPNPLFLRKASHRTLDPGPMYCILEDEVPPNLSQCLVRAGLSGKVTHDALLDAEAVAKCIWRKLHTC